MASNKLKTIRTAVVDEFCHSGTAGGAQPLKSSPKLVARKAWLSILLITVLTI